MRKIEKFVGLLIYLICIISGVAIGYVILNQGLHHADSLGERVVAITESLMVCVEMLFFCFLGFIMEQSVIQLMRKRVMTKRLQWLKEMRKEEKYTDHDSLLEEPPTYIDDRNISLEQSERKRLFSSGETFDIVMGKKEKEEK